MQAYRVLMLLLLLCGSCPRRVLMQDVATGMLLAAAQVKELIETGGGARQEQSVEILGQRMSGGMQLGFGDAMRPAGRRRR